VDSRIAAPPNTGIPPFSVVHPPRCMRAIGLVAMFHVEPSRAGRDGRLPAKRSVYNLESAPESCRSHTGAILDITSICFPKALVY
jgi:hypothetical protein